MFSFFRKNLKHFRPKCVLFSELQMPKMVDDGFAEPSSTLNISRVLSLRGVQRRGNLLPLESCTFASAQSEIPIVIPAKSLLCSILSLAKKAQPNGLRIHCRIRHLCPTCLRTLSSLSFRIRRTASHDIAFQHAFYRIFPLTNGHSML